MVSIGLSLDLYTALCGTQVACWTFGEKRQFLTSEFW